LIKFEFVVDEPLKKVFFLFLYVKRIVGYPCPLAHDDYFWGLDYGVLHAFETLYLEPLGIKKSEVNDSVRGQHIVH